MKIKIITTSAVISIIMSTTALASNIGLVVDGELKKANSIVQNKGVTTIDITELCDALSIPYSIDMGKNEVTATYNDNTLTVGFNSNTAVINGNTVELVSKGYEVPVRDVCGLLDIKVGYDKDKGIQLTTNEPVVSNVAEQVANQKTEIAKAETVYTFDEAKKMALDNNKNLENLEDSMKLVDVNLKDLELAFSTGAVLYVPQDTRTSMFYSMEQLRKAEDAEEYQKEMIEVTAEYTLRSLLEGLSSAEDGLLLLQKNKELQEVNLDNTTAKYNLGMVSVDTLKKAQDSYTKTCNDIDNLKLSINMLKGNINDFLGLDYDADISIDYTPVVESYTVDDIKKFATIKAQADPTALMAKDKVDLASYDVDLLQANTSDAPKISKVNTYESANREYNSTKNNLEAKVESNYVSLKQLEVKEKQLKEDYQTALRNYNNMLVNYNAGLVTKYEVKAMEIALINAQTAINQNEYAYANKAFALQHPFLLQ